MLSRLSHLIRPNVYLSPKLENAERGWALNKNRWCRQWSALLPVSSRAQARTCWSMQATIARPQLRLQRSPIFAGSRRTAPRTRLNFSQVRVQTAAQPHSCSSHFPSINAPHTWIKERANIPRSPSTATLSARRLCLHAPTFRRTWFAAAKEPQRAPGLRGRQRTS